MRSAFLFSPLGKLLCGIAGVLLIGGVTYVWVDQVPRLNPTATLASITGRRLPEGVKATHYEHQVTDNLFHTTHYWVLRGDTAGIRKLLDGTGFSESDDAPHMLPDTHELFGLDLGVSDVASGFEWELDRDRWFWIFRGEQMALYAH